MGVSALRVINDDKVTSSKGFGAHSHQGIEIIKYLKRVVLNTRAAWVMWEDYPRNCNKNGVTI